MDLQQVSPKPKDYLPYGNGCDKIINGERHLFCANCFECPLPDCRANSNGDSIYRFRLMHTDNNGKGNGNGTHSD